MKQKTKTKIREVKTIIVWLLIASLKWFWQALPKTKYQLSLFVNLIVINYLTWFMFWLPFTVKKMQEIINIEPVVKIKTVEKEIIKTPELGAEERYYFLLEHNKIFREYIEGLASKVKRNNPGNLRCANQPNSTCENGFAKFATIQDGFRALIMQVQLDQSRDLTLREFITKYSPHFENDTEWLIKVACDKLNLEEQELINYLDTIKLSQFMVNQEYSIAIVEY